MMDSISRRIRVLIVDDHDIVRQGLRRVLEFDKGIEIVGEARDGAEAIRKADALIPEVIVMDLKMPDMDGITATREIKKRLPQVYVLILTMFADEYIEEAIEAGVSGYMLKDGDSSKISRAIKQLREGVNPISPALNKKLVTEYMKLRKRDLFTLTRRQQQLLELMCEGIDSESICLRMGISMSTEKRELRNIYNILDVNCRAHAISVAIKHGLLCPKGMAPRLNVKVEEQD
jgi:DNA-binding NarL/FixJ family response regulator